MHEELMRRIEDLERDHRRLKRLGLTAALCLAAALLVAATPSGKKVPEVISARSFQVLDQDGKVAAKLTAEVILAKSFHVVDKDNKVRAKLTAVSGKPALIFQNEKEIIAGVYSRGGSGHFNDKGQLVFLNGRIEGVPAEKE